jgi:hypothetical protein
MGKFFNITVKPTVTAAIQHLGAFTAFDLVFDWTAFNMPKGGAALRGATAIFQGTDGGVNTGVDDFQLYFAQPDRDGTAPGSLGTAHATASGVGYYNNLIGALELDGGADVKGLDRRMIYSTGGGAGGDQIPFTVLEGQPHLTKDGCNTVYIAGIGGTGWDWNFSTGVITSRAVDVSGLSAAQLVNADIEGTDPRQCFDVGDIIHAEDGIILGEIESMADANTITFKTDGSKQYHANGEVLFTNKDSVANWIIQNGAGAAGDLASGDELYNIHPIKIILHFER